MNCAPCLVLLLLAWQTGRAQTADEFFNGGAQLYISNNIPSALERTEKGLKLYPNDVKLKKLEELLKHQQKQQQQQKQKQNQRQNQRNQRNKSQQQKNQQSQKQNSSNQQKQQQQQKRQKQSAQQNQEQNQSGRKENEKQQAAQGQKMTPQEAKRLLDAQKDNEQVLQWKPPKNPEEQNQPIKDW